MTEQVEPHILKRYNLVKKVGSGAYGHVWKVTDRKTGDTLALKKIFDAFQHSTDAQRTFREIILLHQLDHQNIIKLVQVIRAENDKDLYLVFEFMEADLHNAIGQKILKDAHNRYILYQLVKGIKFLHSAEIIHRDLKPSNLLLNSDCSMKICDFGLARSMIADKNNSDVVLTEQVATRWYRAPQVLLGSHTYDKSADIWSIGCILAQILIGKPIFPGNSTLNQLQRILSFTGKPSRQDVESLNAQNSITMIEQVIQTKQRPINQWFKQGTPTQAIGLVLKMLQFNPQKRPTAAQILKNVYLAGFSNPKQQTDSKKIIKPPVSDNTKLNLKDYRILIYQHIKKVYSQKQHQFIQPSQQQYFCGSSDIPKKVQRPSTSQKYQSCQAAQYRTNSNNSKNQKPRTSEVKTSHHVLSNGKMNSSNSYYEEEEKIRKKNSLKQILKSKKSLIPYKSTQKIVTVNPTKKFTREPDGSLLKQNRAVHGKFF